MTSIKAVLFDLDGTLLDTANDLGEALNYVLSKYQLPPISRQHYRPVASDGAKGLLELGFKDQLSQFDYDQLRDEFLTFYQQNIAHHTQLYNGISELIASLNNRNIPWGIVTNKPESLTKQLLPYFSELSSSAVMVAGDTLTQRKPDPAPLYYACETLNVLPEHCLYVGDAQRDIEAGNRANMTTIVAAWGYIKSSDDISSWQADKIANTVDECLMFTN